MQQRDDRVRAEGGDEATVGRRPYVSVAGRRIPIPRSRLARLGTGGALVVLGLFGFLPVLGFWMVPVGLLVLSYDIAAVRRRRRRAEVWWKKRRPKNGKKS